MKNLFCTVAVLSSMAFVSCGDKAQNDGNKANGDSTKSASMESPAATAKTAGKYKIKSGIVTYKMNAMGFDTPTTLYFDDFGAVEANESKSEMEIVGQKVNTHTINFTKDGFTYNLDLEKKTGTKMKAIAPAAGGFNPNNADFSGMSAEQMKKYGISKEASETVLGKECEVYTIDYKEMKVKGTFTVWNNIPLKMNMDMGGMAVTMEATKIEENVAIPASVFAIPADVKVEEVKF